MWQFGVFSILEVGVIYQMIVFRGKQFTLPLVNMERFFPAFAQFMNKAPGRFFIVTFAIDEQFT